MLFFFAFLLSNLFLIFRSNNAMESYFSRHWSWITEKWSTEDKQQKENGQWFSAERFREFSMGIHYAGRKWNRMWKRLKGCHYQSFSFSLQVPHSDVQRTVDDRDQDRSQSSATCLRYSENTKFCLGLLVFTTLLIYVCDMKR